MLHSPHSAACALFGCKLYITILSNILLIAQRHRIVDLIGKEQHGRTSQWGFACRTHSGVYPPPRNHSVALVSINRWHNGDLWKPIFCLAAGLCCCLWFCVVSCACFLSPCFRVWSAHITVFILPCHCHCAITCLHRRTHAYVLTHWFQLQPS